MNLLNLKKGLIKGFFKDLLAEPIRKNDIPSIEKAKTLYKSCLDEGRKV